MPDEIPAVEAKPIKMFRTACPSCGNEVDWPDVLTLNGLLTRCSCGQQYFIRVPN